MDFEIELRPMIGKKHEPSIQAEVDVPLNQYQIILSGQVMGQSPRKAIQIGLVCKAPGSPINYLPQANIWSKEQRAKFSEEIVRQLAVINQSAGLVDSNRKSFDPATDEEIDQANELIAKLADSDEDDSEDDQHF